MCSDASAKEKQQKEHILAAQNRLVEENVGLVYWVLRRFKDRGYDMEELAQVGMVGLIKAARRFDCGRENAFSTYAVPVIIGEIRRFLRDDGMLHVSRSIKEHARQIAAFGEKFETTWNRPPTVEEIAKALGLTKEEVILAVGSSWNVASISEPLFEKKRDGAGSVRTMEEVIADTTGAQERLIDSLALQTLLKELDESAATLIALRYGNGLTQQETARKMGTNQAAISRLEKKILLQLRKKL